MYFSLSVEATQKIKFPQKVIIANFLYLHHVIYSVLDEQSSWSVVANMVDCCYEVS